MPAKKTPPKTSTAKKPAAGKGKSQPAQKRAPGNQPAVEFHPKKDEIESALIAGKTLGEVGKRFGISKAALSRHLRDRLQPKVAKVMAERELKEGGALLDELTGYIRAAKKMLVACEEYLADPLDPEKLFLGPRAEEIDVAYYTIEVGDDGKEFREKHRESLQNIMAKVEYPGMVVTEIKSKHADPRALLLQAANTLAKQVEVFAKIHGDIQDVTLNIAVQPAFIFLVQKIIEATADYPGVRREIVSAIKTLEQPD